MTIGEIKNIGHYLEEGVALIEALESLTLQEKAIQKDLLTQNIWDKNNLTHLMYHIDPSKTDEMQVSLLATSWQGALKTGWNILFYFPHDERFMDFVSWAKSKIDQQPIYDELYHLREIHNRPFAMEFLNDEIERVNTIGENVPKWLQTFEQVNTERGVGINDYKNWCFAVGYTFFCKGVEINWSALFRTFGHVDLGYSIRELGGCFYKVDEGYNLGRYRKLLGNEKQNILISEAKLFHQPVVEAESGQLKDGTATPPVVEGKKIPKGRTKDSYNTKIKAKFFEMVIKHNTTIIGRKQYQNNDEKFKDYAKLMHELFGLVVNHGTLENNWPRPSNPLDQGESKLLRELLITHNYRDLAVTIATTI